MTEPLKPIIYKFWLTFDAFGRVRITKEQPKTAANERSMQMTATLPRELFITPQLRGTITIPNVENEPMQIDIIAAAEAMKKVLGVNIDLHVEHPET